MKNMFVITNGVQKHCSESTDAYGRTRLKAFSLWHRRSFIIMACDQQYKKETGNATAITVI